MREIDSLPGITKKLFKFTTCIPRLNKVERVVSMPLQQGIHVLCLKGNQIVPSLGYLKY